MGSDLVDQITDIDKKYRYQIKVFCAVSVKNVEQLSFGMHALCGLLTQLNARSSTVIAIYIRENGHQPCLGQTKLVD